jgi:hypothetical protein
LNVRISQNLLQNTGEDGTAVYAQSE